MRHRVGMLGTATALLLAAAVVTAAPAEARRNIGGLVTETCTPPGNPAVGTHTTGPGAVQICFIQDPKGASVVIATPK